LFNKTFSTPYHSEGNGATERTFRTFHSILSKYLDPRDHEFEDTLDCATFAYNTSMHETTLESPFFLLFGRDPVLNIEHILDPRLKIPLSYPDMEFKGKLIICLRAAWKAAAEVTLRKQAEMKRQYDKTARPCDIEIGDRVLLKNYIVIQGAARKWQSPWRGIFRVIDREGLHLIITSCSSPQSNPFRVHINQVKKLVEPTGPVCTAPHLSEGERGALGQARAEELNDFPGHTHNVPAPESIPPEEDREKASSPRYNLRPRAPRINSILICIFFFLIVKPAMAAEDEDGSQSTSLLILNFLIGLFTGFLITFTLFSSCTNSDDSHLTMVREQSSASTELHVSSPMQPESDAENLDEEEIPELPDSDTGSISSMNFSVEIDRPMQKCEYCDFLHHDILSCRFRKIKIKREIQDSQDPKWRNTEALQVEIGTALGLAVDQLGMVNGVPFMVVRRSIPMSLYRRFIRHDVHNDRYWIEGPHTHLRRSAYLIATTERQDYVFRVDSNFDPEGNYLSPYFITYTFF
jgi:hypothetical protein